jgi:glycosyltransferase involved in cell wall biosynthesis
MRTMQLIPPAADRLETTDDRDPRIGPSACAPRPPVEIDVGLLTGGIDKPYAFGLAMELISKGVRLDFIGSNEVDSPALHTSPHLRFLNLRGDQRHDVGFATKVRRILLYYARLIRYASAARPKVFHILWNNKFQVFDRTLLMLYYKLHGKKIALTAHNVNAHRRDATDSLLNRVSLKIQYRVADHIFVHTEKMKRELLEDFGVRERAVTVIPFGINNSVPDTALTPEQAKQRLGIKAGERTILFFGRIGPYKGLEHLVAAFQQLAATNANYRLVIVGKAKEGCEQYLDEIRRTIERNVPGGRVLQRIQHVPDEDTELYFKAADVLALPYTEVFQSGVLFLAYSFGLPVIATDVGSFGDDVVEGQTGFLCRPCDPVDLTRALATYFDSDLFGALESRRPEIRDYANARHSWDVVGHVTRNVYLKLSGRLS